MTIRVGTLLADRFQIVRALQTGGMGSVFEARDLQNNGLHCAIKKMLEHLSEGDMAEVFRARFAAETNFLKQLCHPGIPRLLDSFIIDGSFYIAMEFVPGRNLAQELEERTQLTGTTLSVEQLLRDVSQVLDILNYLHNQSPPLVHRDIKPANMIREHPSGRIKLVDFGLARSLGSENKTQTQIGTLGYSPLEQLQGRAEPRSDLYALGVTMHELLTGIPPTPLSIPPIATIRPDLEPALAAFIDKACSPKPEGRYESAQHMQQALLALQPTAARTPQDLPNLPGEAERPAETTKFPEARPTTLFSETKLPVQDTGDDDAEVWTDEGPSQPVEKQAAPGNFSQPLALAATVLLAIVLGRALRPGLKKPVPAAPTPVVAAASTTPELPPVNLTTTPTATTTPTPSPVADATVTPLPQATQTPHWKFDEPFYRKRPPRGATPAGDSTEKKPTPHPHETGVTYSLKGTRYPQHDVSVPTHHPKRHGAPAHFQPLPSGLPEPTVSLPDEWSLKGRYSAGVIATMNFNKKTPAALDLLVRTEMSEQPSYRIKDSFKARRDGWQQRLDLPGVDLAFERNAHGRSEVEAIVVRAGRYYFFRVENKDGNMGESQFGNEVAAALNCIDVP